MPEDTADEQAAAARDNVIEEGIKAPAHLQLLPARHTKTLFLVRHGEGYHNVAGAAPAAMRCSPCAAAHLACRPMRAADPLLRSAGKQGYHMYSRQVRPRPLRAARSGHKHR